MRGWSGGLGWLIVAIVFAAWNADAGQPKGLLEKYRNEARAVDQGFKDFSIQDGKKLFFLERLHSSGRTVSCAVCHSQDPRNSGKTRAGKEIRPMAPAVNPERFTDEAKTEKWFRRNCNDVLERSCTAKEKGDLLAYLLSLK